MRIHFDYREDICVLRLEGRFRTGSGREFEETCKELLRSGTRRVVVDCKNVPYLDSTGLSFVVGLHNFLSAQNGSLELVSVNARVREILHLTRLDETLVIRQGATAQAAA
jgi:anti-anti-sigma factor